MVFQHEKLFWMLSFGFVSGHDFSRAVKGLKVNWASQAAEKREFLEGDGLQAVHNCFVVNAALAAEGAIFIAPGIP